MKIHRVAGLSLLGFCVASFGLDRTNIGPVASQAGAFCGAFIGGLAAQWRLRSKNKPRDSESPNAE